MKKEFSAYHVLRFPWALSICHKTREERKEYKSCKNVTSLFLRGAETLHQVFSFQYFPNHLILYQSMNYYFLYPVTISLAKNLSGKTWHFLTVITLHSKIICWGEVIKTLANVPISVLNPHSWNRCESQLMNQTWSAYAVWELQNKTNEKQEVYECCNGVYSLNMVFELKIMWHHSSPSVFSFITGYINACMHSFHSTTIH